MIPRGVPSRCLPLPEKLPSHIGWSCPSTSVSNAAVTMFGVDVNPWGVNNGLDGVTGLVLCIDEESSIVDISVEVPWLLWKEWFELLFEELNFSGGSTVLKKLLIYANFQYSGWASKHLKRMLWGNKRISLGIFVVSPEPCL